MEVITLLFVLSSIIIILTPGQDMMMVMSQSISHGKKAGIITALGVSFGLLGHTLLATIGLGSLLMTSTWLFDVIKFIALTGCRLSEAKDLMWEEVDLDNSLLRLKDSKTGQKSVRSSRFPGVSSELTAREYPLKVPKQ